MNSQRALPEIGIIGFRSWPSLVIVRIQTRPHGTFRASRTGKRAATLGVEDRFGNLTDIVAWFTSPSPWWLRRGDQTPVLGAKALAIAAWDHTPIALHRTPEHWLKFGGEGVCILDWGVDLRPLFQGVPQINCTSRELKERLWCAFRKLEPKIVVQPVEVCRAA